MTTLERQQLVVLTGAGISAESGLQTFRDGGGLWENHRVEDVATPGAWKKDPEMVLRFYNMRRKQVTEAEPNAAHKALAWLEQFFKVHIITQNIDDLHERAGSANVLHLHGEILKMRSSGNPALVYPVRGEMQPGGLAEDGRPLRPDIVWFEEPVPRIAEAIPLMQQADIFVLIGSSLAIYPAAGLLDFLRPATTAYVIDKVIPPLGGRKHIVPIASTATEGVRRLISMWGLPLPE